MRVIHLDTVDSTNLEARRCVDAGEAGPLWITSVEQTAGKGRLGRHWVSKPGNLYATLLWPTTAPAATLSQLSFVAALAVVDASSKFANPAAITLKWPNDCLLDGHKFCGILAESLGPSHVAVGIGINIAHVPEGLPYQAARLCNATVESLFEALRLSLSNRLTIWDEGRGFAAIIKDWQSCCPSIGQTVSVEGDTGIFQGLAPDGALMLRRKDGSTRLVYAGDVRLVYQSFT